MLGDSKYVSRDSDIVLGLFSPFKFGLRDYEGYNITKFKDNIRFLEVCINRNGQMGGVCPLFFDGAVCSFNELPLPNNIEEINKIYKYLDSIREVKNTEKSFIAINPDNNPIKSNKKFKFNILNLFKNGKRMFNFRKVRKW